MAESSAFHAAIVKNDLELVAQLLKGDGKAEVNREVNGEFPIHIAAKARNNKLVKLLVDNGANVNQAFQQAGSMQGYTALHFAARNGDIDLVQMLHKLGADLNRAANDGWRPIHAAAFGGKRPAMLALLDCGADIDGANPHGHTALTYSANYGRAADVRELIARGAKTDIVDKLGDTMLHHTFHYRMSKLFEGEYDVPDVQLDVAVLLALQSVDPEAKNIDGEVAAHYLLEEDWPSINKFLKVIGHNASKLNASKVEWNFMTFVGAKVEVLVGLGIDLKHAIDLVELAGNVDRERVAAKKSREEAKATQGGCPVMTGKRKKKSDSGSPATPSSATTPHHGHGDIDISKIDPNGPDPSGGQCPFFKKPNASMPTNTSLVPSTSPVATQRQQAYQPVDPLVQAAAAEQGLFVGGFGGFVQQNHQLLVKLLLAFFLGIWYEQNTYRVFGAK